MNFLSVCSGIEAASVAWNPLGWQAVGFSENDAFPAAVLAHHYPEVPNYGDLTKWREWDELRPIDLLCGGTPCQSWSLAGLRKGLADPRGALVFDYLGLVERYRPQWLVWENVVGVLSKNKGRDFGSFLGALAEFGYGWAYRVLDTQYVRVDGFERAIPQRRRRVFVIGCLGSWTCASAVLFDRESLHGHTAPRREAGQGVADAVAKCLRTNSGGVDREDGHILIPDTVATLTGKPYADRGESDDDKLIPDVANCLTHRMHKGINTTVDEGQTPIVCYENHAQDSRIKDCGNLSPTLAAKAGTGGGNLPLVQCIHGTQDPDITNDIAHTLGRNNGQENALSYWLGVRRLTEIECERLMGFEDNYTRIPWKGRPAEKCPASHRYKALGNSWSINSARWIGRRIEMVEPFRRELCA